MIMIFIHLFYLFLMVGSDQINLKVVLLSIFRQLYISNGYLQVN